MTEADTFCVSTAVLALPFLLSGHLEGQAGRGDVPNDVAAEGTVRCALEVHGAHAVRTWAYVRWSDGKCVNKMCEHGSALRAGSTCCTCSARMGLRVHVAVMDNV